MNRDNYRPKYKWNSLYMDRVAWHNFMCKRKLSIAHSHHNYFNQNATWKEKNYTKIKRNASHWVSCKFIVIFNLWHDPCRKHKRGCQSKNYSKIHAHFHKCERECKEVNLKHSQVKIILEAGIFKCFKDLQMLSLYL